MTCCASAMTVKSAAAPISRLTGLPATASSMKYPNYLGVDELQADAREQQNRYRGHQPCLRAKVVDQQVDILPEA